MTSDAGPETTLTNSALLADYSVTSGAADELFDAKGAMRPVWQPFVDYLARLGPENCAARFAKGDQYLRDVGVFFRRYSTGSGEERDWPLSHIPVLLHEREWQGISQGLIQRAELLERVVADIYGGQSLVRSGQLPAELVAQNPEWLRPMVGVRPASGFYLHHLAFEIGRNPDGSWFVLGDRTQAPSGAGFALENRRTSGHMYHDFFPDAQVFRLAGFFRAFRDAMRAMGRYGNETPAILTPGPGNDTYFEHIFIARYLGLMLLEGEDLTVQNGQAMVRTVSGLKPISMLWRRLDAQFVDPMELNENSQIGTPGLIEAMRAGNLTMLNAPGSGILETRALMAFLPQIAQTMLGQPLAMPNIATWWCGDDSARDYVRQNILRMSLSPAMATGLPYDSDVNAMAPAHVPNETRLDEWIGKLVGQEAVNLSTTPAMQDGKLVPRPMTVRVFLARTSRGWSVMPGGYARIGRNDAHSALALQQGGSVADVWILSDHQVPQESLEPRQGSYTRVPEGALPSRAADNLFWLGRYVERADSTIRLKRAYHRRLAEGESATSERMQFLAQHLKAWGATTEPQEPGALANQFGGATLCASKVRDRFSVDAWVALNDLNKTLLQKQENASPGDDAARTLTILLRKLSGFGGLVLENMYRSTGWRFLEFGRALERALNMNTILQNFTAADAPESCLDFAIEAGDCTSTHQRLYMIDPNRQSVLDLMMLDLRNPRSVLFQVESLRKLVPDLPRNTDHQVGRSVLLRQVDAVHQFLIETVPDWVVDSDFDDIRTRMNEVSFSLTSSYMR